MSDDYQQDPEDELDAIFNPKYSSFEEHQYIEGLKENIPNLSLEELVKRLQSSSLWPHSSELKESLKLEIILRAQRDAEVLRRLHWLLMSLPGSYRSQRGALIEILGRVAEESSVPFLAEMCRADIHRLKAAEALRQIGTEQAVKIADAYNSRADKTSIFSLAAWRPEKARQNLRPLLNKLREEMRQELSHFGPDDKIDLWLSEALGAEQDEEPDEE